MSEAVEIRALLAEYIAVLNRLRPYGIESIADFAEHLFAMALDGELAPRGTKGHDVFAEGIGRVQVKERRLPPDGRIEERLLLKNVSWDSCDYIAAVIFENDLKVKKAILVAHADVWELMQTHSDPQKKVRFDLMARLPSAVDMTERLRRLLA